MDYLDEKSDGLNIELTQEQLEMVKGVVLERLKSMYDNQVEDRKVIKGLINDIRHSSDTTWIATFCQVLGSAALGVMAWRSSEMPIADIISGFAISFGYIVGGVVAKKLIKDNKKTKEQELINYIKSKVQDRDICEDKVNNTPKITSVFGGVVVNENDAENIIKDACYDEFDLTI